MHYRLLAALCLLIPALAAAQDTPDDIMLSLFPEHFPQAGETIRVVAQLTRRGKPLEADDLKPVDGEKIHLLLIDPTLADYQHLHPQPTATPGSYVFAFTPETSSGYRAWADVTPMHGSRQFAAADMGEVQPAALQLPQSTIAEAGGYRFVLTFEDTPHAGKPTLFTITVYRKDGATFAELEPVMGAFAEIIGFQEGLEIAHHANPLSQNGPLGGPKLYFYIRPHRAGPLKLFARFKIHDETITVPFSVLVLR